jgi:hypothetical protein
VFLGVILDCVDGQCTSRLPLASTGNCGRVCWEVHVPESRCDRFGQDDGFTCGADDYCAAVYNSHVDSLRGHCSVVETTGCSVNPVNGRCAACTASDCAALAAIARADPVCAAVRVTSGTDDQTCPVACAELFASARERCSGKVAPAFEAVAPEVIAVCASTAIATLAGAPRSIIVDGLGCHADANGANFQLKAAPLNGRPHYATADGKWHLFWAPDYLNLETWLISEHWSNLRLASPTYLISASELPPTGSARWTEFCNSDSTIAVLQLSPSSPDIEECASTLDALVPRLAATCCRPEDGGCGKDDGVSAQCSIDCAYLWRHYAKRCPTTRDLGDPALSSFLEDECGAVLVGLDVLDNTSKVQDHATTEFAFEARSGVRYDVDVRVGDGSGESEPCMDNRQDDLFGQGKCDELISAGTVSCAHDLCAECGQYAHQCDRACGFICPASGVSTTNLYVLPPGVSSLSQLSQAVVTQLSAVGGDKGIGFTAASTGTYTVIVWSAQGSGPVTVTATAVGTSLERSPLLSTDGLPHSVYVDCTFADCTFQYDKAPPLDSDGRGFDLVLPDAQASSCQTVTFFVSTSQFRTRQTADNTTHVCCRRDAPTQSLSSYQTRPPLPKSLPSSTRRKQLLEPLASSLLCKGRWVHGCQRLLRRRARATYRMTVRVFHRAIR